MFDDEPEPLVRARAYPKVQVEQPDIHELTTMEVGARPIYNQDDGGRRLGPITTRMSGSRG